ncbi:MULTISPECIES: M56 family metallopeptidase [unclassified Clostridioides]|uniref:M56 family metallopeptidase n=1 Tax=unclassified Clostridioides TaxID=2635829 RepID=UPI001D105B2F
MLLPPHDYKLKELEWIFRHELMHFKSKDLCLKYVVLFLKIVYWFNPVIYIMDKHMDLDCELYCDERVLKKFSTEDKKDYALTIINAMRRSSNSSNKFVAGLHKKSDIKKRVTNMFNEKYKNGILIALIICLLFSVTFFKFDSTSLIEDTAPLNKSECVFEGREEGMFITIDFTYANAPEKLRREHEENCRAVGIIPKDSDSIEVFPRDFRYCLDLKK